MSSAVHMSHRGLGADAIVELYRRLRPRLVHFFLRRTRDLDTAFDLVGETFTRAVEHARRFRGGTDADPWVWGIARNVLAEHVRRDRVQQRGLQRLALERPETSAELPEDRAGDEPGPAVQALTALVVDQRDALHLRVVEQLDYDIVARRLGISEPTARARVSRGLRKLALSLEGGHNLEGWTQ